MRYKITLSYDGSAFCGWQIQKNAPSVQQTVSQGLRTLVGSECPVTGAGRTDTGVNALEYVAHFDCDCPLDAGLVCYKLNAILPEGITIHDICPTDAGFHARYDAKLREYQYFIAQSKNPFSRHYSWWCKYRLDIDRMNLACSLLTGVHDCSCFEKTGSSNATSICEIFYARWEKFPFGGPFPDGMVFTIGANRFLRNMVRAIVGTMVDIGRGVRDPQEITRLLEGGSRCDAGQSVPGHALFLTKIEY